MQTTPKLNFLFQRTFSQDAMANKETVASTKKFIPRDIVAPLVGVVRLGGMVLPGGNAGVRDCGYSLVSRASHQSSGSISAVR